MSETTCHMSISLDGFVAGPDQSLEHPLGRRGIELHHWHLDEPLHDADRRVRDLLLRPRGAYVMGRNMFGPIRGPWQGDWRGWWGDDPPYHAPVFVLTHHEHVPIEMAGGTTFHFVTDGFDAAFARAAEAAVVRVCDERRPLGVDVELHGPHRSRPLQDPRERLDGLEVRGRVDQVAVPIDARSGAPDADGVTEREAPSRAVIQGRAQA